MTVPYRNDVPGLLPQRPDDHDHSPLQIPRRNDAGLAVVEAIIWCRGVGPGEDLRRTAKIEPALAQDFVALRRVERDFSDLM
jgi:hypothetical protein